MSIDFQCGTGILYCKYVTLIHAFVPSTK